MALRSKESTMRYGNPLKGVLRKTDAAITSLRYHRHSIKKALGALASIERTQGKLPRELIDECDRYAIDVLGAKKFAPWLYVYTAVAGTFRPGWMPDNFYRSVVVPRLKGAYGSASSLNGFQTKFFGEGFFPDLLYSINGLFVDPSNRVIDPKAFLIEHFESHDRIVFKRDNSSQGMGVRIYRSDEVGQVRFEALGNGVFQDYIVQHPFFASFHPHSVATIRMTTAVNSVGAVSLRACYLRLGTGSDTHVMSSTNVRVPVNVASGELGADGFATDWTRIRAHPDTGKAFAGERIPNFDACIATVIELHSRMPAVRCIGWDIGLDTTGKVKVMEWNGGHNGIKFTEATQGPCFADLGWHTLNQSRRAAKATNGVAEPASRA